MIRPKPLATAIVPPRLTYFGEDKPAGGDTPAPTGGDPNADILSFTPPDIGNVGDIITGKKDGDLNAPAPGVTPEPKPAPKEPAPKPGAAPSKAAPAEPPAKQLRDELEAVKKERDELKTKYEAGDPRLKEVERAVKEKEDEIKEAKTKLADYERRLAMADPAVTKELQVKDTEYDGAAQKFYSSVPELTTPQVHSLVREFDKLPFGKDGYREAREAFEAKVNLALGAAEGAEHRKLERALEFIERSHEYAVERPRLVSEIEKSALQLKTKAEIESFSKQQAAVRERIAQAKTVPEDLRASQPFHPRVMLDTFSKALSPEQNADLENGLSEYVELIAAGVRPKTDADFVGMSPQQIHEARSQDLERMEMAKASLPDVLFQGLKALRLFPALVKDWQRLSAKVKEDEINPPDPTLGGDPAAGGDPNDLKSFKAPDLATLQF